MPIRATRNGIQPRTTGDPPMCSAQSTLAPNTATIFGCAVQARTRALQVFQGLTAAIDWTFLDPNGNPVDLTSCGGFDDDGSSVTLRLMDAAITPNAAPWATSNTTGTVTDAAAGQASFTLSDQVTKYAGVFIAEASVQNTSGATVFLNQFALIVNRTARGAQFCPGRTGPPSVAEIRMHIRDSDPTESILLGTVQFDLAEIAHAIEMPVLYWNEAPPEVANFFTTLNFPFRYNWLEAVVGQLYSMAAYWYLKNRLQGQAGNVSIDDLNKYNEYKRVADEKQAKYEDWVKRRKVAINAEMAVQTTGSLYPVGWW